MNRFWLVKILHLVFLGLLLSFIFVYFTELQPAKKQAQCAEFSTRSVLGAASNEDAFDLYNKLYKNCLTLSK